MGSSVGRSLARSPRASIQGLSRARPPRPLPAVLDRRLRRLLERAGRARSGRAGRRIAGCDRGHSSQGDGARDGDAGDGPRPRDGGAANSLVRAGHAWQGATTTTVLAPLARACIDPAGRTAAVVGYSGAGRSVAAELRRRGAAVTLVNRGTPRATYASELLGLPWTPLAEFRAGGVRSDRQRDAAQRRVSLRRFAAGSGDSCRRSALPDRRRHRPGRRRPAPRPHRRRRTRCAGNRDWEGNSSC